MNKKLIFLIIVIFVIFFSTYQFFSGKKPNFTLIEVKRGRVVQSISETGQVKKGERIDLSFKSTGKIKEIYVKVGEKVKTNQKLIKLDTSDLEIQLKKAKANLELAQAKLNKLLAGASAEEIKIAETKVNNAEIALSTAKENLEQALEDAQNSLNDIYLKSYNALNVIDSIQNKYFTLNDQESIKVRENKGVIENAFSEIKNYLNIVKNNSTEDNITTALSHAKDSLSNISDALGIIRETCEASSYRNLVSSTDKNSLDNQRTIINTALTTITNSQQIISSMKLSVKTAEGQLQVAKDELALVTSKPRQEDIDLYQAQVEEAQAQVSLLENSLKEAVLVSPVDGEVIKIYKEIGETVQPMLSDIVISLLPNASFEIKVDVYEEDIVKIDIGNPVEISFPAFPNQKFKGKVISIDPAEKIIEGVVYYEVTIGPALELGDWIPNEVKPGMTVDLLIETQSKDNVLIIPEDAIQREGGKAFVEVFENGSIQKREIKLGLKGENEFEVISGLNEGEKVVIR